MKLFACSLRIATIRNFHHSRSLSKAASGTNSPLYQLRQKTGLTYNLCKEALVKHDNDLEKAESWLNAQALAHGLQKASKVKGRQTREGLVGLAASKDNRILTELEINCETDFVAKNQTFRDYAIDLLNEVVGNTKREDFEAESVPGQKSIEKLKLSKNYIGSLEKNIASIVVRLGENIVVRRVIQYRVIDDMSRLFGHIHSKVGFIENDHTTVSTGRFGAIVALRSLASDSINLREEIGIRLCKHIIGYNPTYIELPSELRKHLEEAAKEKQSKQESTNENNECDEPEDRDELTGWNMSSGERDDWPSIMDQQLILSDDTSVREYCKRNSISIEYFRRFEIGES